MAIVTVCLLMVTLTVFYSAHRLFLCSGVMGGEIQAVEHIVRSLSTPPLSPDVVMGKFLPLLRSSEVEASGHYLLSQNMSLWLLFYRVRDQGVCPQVVEVPHYFENPTRGVHS